MTEPTVTYRGRTKYDEQIARKYQTRKPAKHLGEMRLVDRTFDLVPMKHRVLDSPSGGGRVTLHLAQKGYSVTAADLSDAMIAITRENVAANHLNCAVEKQDIEKFTYADRSFDTVICFRLFHHFPTLEIRRRAVAELCRVARKYVALSYYSPLSPASVRRIVRSKLSGKPLEHFPTSLRQVKGCFSPHGFRLVRDFARAPLIHTLHMALFERVGETAP